MSEYLERLRMAAVRSVTEDDMAEIFKELVRKAKKGDLQAVKLLATFVLPQQAAAPATPLQHARPKRVPALPGTPGKLQLLEHRAQNGQPLHRARDAQGE